MSTDLYLPHQERAKWEVLTVREAREADSDWYIAKYGPEKGLARFFAENPVTDVATSRGNLLMYMGASCIWGLLTNTNSVTNFSNANTYVAVGDGGPTALSGTVSVTNASTSITFSTSQTSLIDNYIIVTGDSTYGIYKVASGSGTSWTLATAYGGTTNATASSSVITGESPNQTDLSGSTNKVYQAADASFPTYVDGNTALAVTAATAANPIVITTGSAHGWSVGDFIHVQGVKGNTGANGLWQLSAVTSTTATLANSINSGSFTTSPYAFASKNNVLVTQATFGNASANFAWYEWLIRNASSGASGRPLNRKVTSLGVKTSSASWTFKTAISVA